VTLSLGTARATILQCVLVGAIRQFCQCAGHEPTAASSSDSLAAAVWLVGVMKARSTAAAAAAGLTSKNSKQFCL
jgi:hypothetical protein